MRCGGFVMMNLRFDVDISYCWCAVASVCLNTRLTGEEREDCPSVQSSVMTTMVKTSQTNCGNACVSSDN